MKRIFWGLVAIIALVACTVKMSTSINVSDLLSSENKKLVVDLQVLVMSCSEDNIQRIQTAFEKRKIKAHYNKCGSTDVFNEYASFSLSIPLIKYTTKDALPDADIAFVVMSDALALITASDFASILDSGSEFDDKITISSIEFSLVNDRDSDFVIKPTLAFVDEKPVYQETVIVPAFSKVLIKLPDVANKLLEQSGKSYMILKFER